MDAKGDGITTCANCGRLLGAAAHRCFYCGAIKGRQCPKCKAVVPAGAEICHVCKRDIPSCTPNFVLETVPDVKLPVGAAIVTSVPPPAPPRHRSSNFVLVGLVVVLLLIVAAGVVWHFSESGKSVAPFPVRPAVTGQGYNSASNKCVPGARSWNPYTTLNSGIPRATLRVLSNYNFSRSRCIAPLPMGTLGSPFFW